MNILNIYKRDLYSLIKKETVFFDLEDNEIDVGIIIFESSDFKELENRIKNIAKIELIDKGLNEIPEEIKIFKNLEILDLSNNHISKIENIEKLPLLDSLYINNNKIKFIPDLINNSNLYLSIKDNFDLKYSKYNFIENNNNN